MQERLLQYIWHQQYFHSSGLTTVQGQTLEVMDCGTWNHAQGPDFLNARVRIDGTLWAGQVEIHIRSSDWHRHKHEGDAFYLNIILHVVWEHDLAGSPGGLPTLQLKDRIPVRLLETYSRWMDQPTGIACKGNLSSVSELVWIEWKQALAFERIKQKAEAIQQWVWKAGGNWESTFWRLIFHYLGGKVNGKAFEQVFDLLGWPLIRKYTRRLEWLEALLLGTAGMLGENADQLSIETRTQYQGIYLKLVNKHQLRASENPMKLLRMRPASFPLLRIRQAARLLHNQPALFNNLGANLSVKDWQALLITDPTNSNESGQSANTNALNPIPSLGTVQINSIIINVILPMTTVYPYAHSYAEHRISKAVDHLRELAVEVHHITQVWRSLGVDLAQARDSQALLQLYEHYCQKKNCLACRVGQICLSNPTSINSA